MDDNVNPFLTIGFTSKEYFCDREYELEILKRYAKNGVNTTLFSIRRLGKSALIQRLFDDLEEENCACINRRFFTKTQNQCSIIGAKSIDSSVRQRNDLFP